MEIEIRNAIKINDDCIDCEINHPVYGWIPFSANVNDIEPHGREIHAAAKLLLTKGSET